MLALVLVFVMAFSVNEKPNLQLAHVCHCALAHMSYACFTPLLLQIAGVSTEYARFSK
jgi:hypothetical protein